MNRATGRVIWITGLSGAGKSTLAQQTVTLLETRGDRAILLDGDAVREIIGDPAAGHDLPGRRVNAMRICRLARFLSNQGFTVVVATMSLFREVHEWNRLHLPSYFEVFLKVNLETLRHRDARGLYSRAARGEAADVVGVHLEFDVPHAAHLVLTNDLLRTSLEPLAQQILDGLKERTDDPSIR